MSEANLCCRLSPASLSGWFAGRKPILGIAALLTFFEIGTAVRVVILMETLPEGMGYAGLAIPKTMARMGIDVHYVTAGLPVYHSMKDYQATYGGFHNARDKPGTVREIEGYPVHFLDYRSTYGGVRMLGLADKLHELKPDIVQTFGHVTWAAVDAALLQPRLGFRLFTGNHTTASVYPLAKLKNPGFFNPLRIKEYLIRKLPGRFVSSRAERCYGATTDCSEIAQRFMGVPQEKLTTLPLGVETDVFHPPADDKERSAALALRRRLGVGDREIMCVYTGRFTADKNPLLLAEAVHELRQEGHPFRAVLFGEGVQADAIKAIEGTVVHPFVHYTELGDLYRAADIGIWPTQESTSMIDCAASGTPIIVNDTIAATERVDGNGLRYRLGDRDDLRRALLELRDADLRACLGKAGAEKMERQFSWRALVQQRIDDYRRALQA